MTIDLDAFKAAYDWQAAFQEAVNGCYASYWDEEQQKAHPIHNVASVTFSVEGEPAGMKSPMRQHAPTFAASAKRWASN